MRRKWSSRTCLHRRLGEDGRVEGDDGDVGDDNGSDDDVNARDTGDVGDDGDESEGEVGSRTCLHRRLTGSNVRIKEREGDRETETETQFCDISCRLGATSICLPSGFDLSKSTLPCSQISVRLSPISTSSA